MSERGATRDFASGLSASRGPEDRWLSVYEVGAMTLQHPDSVRRWIAAGTIAAEDRGRLGNRIRESEVERFLRDHIRDQGRNPADHGLNSNVVDILAPPGEPSEREKAGAGWPFNHRSASSMDQTGGS